MKKLFTLTFILFSFFAEADYWTQKADFGGTVRAGAFYFSIGNKGYIGTGTDAYPVYHFRKDFWEYDVGTNTWTQKADFAGQPRYTAFGFSLGTKGYVGTGWDQVMPSYNDLWQYDQVLNSWTQKGNFPGIARQGAVAIVLNNKAYAGLGANGNTILSDFYSYNDTTDTWTQLSNFSGTPSRVMPFGLGVNNKIYIGCGVTTYPQFNLTNEFWEFDPTLNAWTQKVNFPGSPRFAMVYFTLNNKGYAGIGKDVTNFFNDFYEYNPGTNLWTQKTNSPVIGIEGGFTIGSHGYCGCGFDTTGLINQFWEYTPDNTTSIEELPTSNFQFSISPNPAKDFITISSTLAVKEKITVTITDVEGKKVYETNLLASDFRLPTSDFAKGIYFVTLDNGKQKAVKKFVKE